MTIATKNRPQRRSRTLVGCLALGALVGVLGQINAGHSATDWLVILGAIAVALSVVAVIGTAISRAHHGTAQATTSADHDDRQRRPAG